MECRLSDCLSGFPQEHMNFSWLVTLAPCKEDAALQVLMDQLRLEYAWEKRMFQSFSMDFQCIFTWFSMFFFKEKADPWALLGVAKGASSEDVPLSFLNANRIKLRFIIYLNIPT